MPYEKILELAESKDLDITTVNLSQITGEFIDYVRNLQSISRTDPGILADFVAVAAKLLLIKSKALLPSLKLTEEEETDIKDFQLRLAAFKMFRPALKHIKNLWEGGFSSFSRPYLCHHEIIFRPPKNLGAQRLLAAAAFIRQKQNEDEDSWQKNRQSLKLKIISVESKIKEVLSRFSDAIKEYSFGQLVAGNSRSETVAVFLAVLHLIKENKIKVEQGRAFEDINVQYCKN